MRRASIKRLRARADTLHVRSLIKARLGASALGVPAVAVCYFVAGKLGMLLAIPPGYATPVWPAAGIAMAALLALGNRAWPGILIGSFALNLRFPIELAGPVSIAKTFGVPLAIAMGASLQALACHALIRRVVGFPVPLGCVSRIVRFMLLAGPIACLISASVGIASLSIGGVIATNAIATHWVTWWVGDVTGVVLFSPLILLWGARVPGRRRRWLTMTVPVACLVALFVTLFFKVNERENRRIQADFEHRTETISAALQRDVDAYVDCLDAVARFMASSEHVDRERFARFVRPMLSHLPGIHALGWIARVEDAQRPAFEEQFRREGFADFSIREMRRGGGVPVVASRREEYLPIRFVEPFESSRSIVGVDIASDPTRRETAFEARDSGKPAASSWIRLIQDTRGELAFVLQVPVYRAGVLATGNSMNGSSLEGLASGAFLINEMMTVSLDRMATEDIAVRVYEEGMGRSFFESGGAVPPSQLTITAARQVQVANRRWVFEFSATAGYLKEHRSLLPWILLVGGLLFTSLLGTFLLVVTGHTAATEELVSLRTHELAEANRRLELEAVERREVLASLFDSQERLHLALKSSAVGTWVWDLTNGRMKCDEYVPPLFGRTPEDMPLTHLAFLELVHGDDRERVLASVVSALHSDTELDEEFQVLRPEGPGRFLSVRGRFHRDENKRPVRLTGVVWDITERHRTRVELEKANRAKSEFVAGVTHELRTPLNGIMGMVELTLETEMTTEQRGYLEVAQGAATSLLGLINDVLDFSKIEAGHLAVEQIEFKLRSCVADTVRTVAIPARRKGLELRYEVDDDVPDTVVGDPGRIRQVLLNLISNAIKFTDRGHVIVRIAIDTTPARGIVMHVAVEDTGIGIAADKQALIFEPFVQADASTTRHYGGTGLGLTISTQLVEAMGGHIWLDSEPGRGSTFHFTIALQIPLEQAIVGTRSGEAARAAHALVVDDSESHLQTLRRVLAGLGMRWRTVAHGDDAVELLAQAARDGAPYDLILMNPSMPGVDEFRLVERLQDTPEIPRIATILMTGRGRPGDATRCRELGVAAYLSKSMTPVELRRAILEALSARQTTGAPLITRHSLRESGRPPRMLLAEDNTLNQVVAVGILEKRGFAVTLVENGREAVEALAHETYDVVLMDMQMPVMDGLQATRAIRLAEQATGARVPIIAMTARATREDREICLEAGMDDHVSKPIRREELFEAIGRAHVGFPETETQTPEIATQHDGVDTSELIAMVDGDLDSLRKMAEILFAQTPRFLSELRHAVEREDRETVERVAHSIKGSIGMWSQGATYRLAETIENDAREGSLAHARERYAALEMELTYLEQNLTAALAEVSAAA